MGGGWRGYRKQEANGKRQTEERAEREFLFPFSFPRFSPSSGPLRSHLSFASASALLLLAVSRNGVLPFFFLGGASVSLFFARFSVFRALSSISKRTANGTKFARWCRHTTRQKQQTRAPHGRSKAQICSQKPLKV